MYLLLGLGVGVLQLALDLCHVVAALLVLLLSALQLCVCLAEGVQALLGRLYLSLHLQKGPQKITSMSIKTPDC